MFRPHRTLSRLKDYPLCSTFKYSFENSSYFLVRTGDPHVVAGGNPKALTIELHQNAYMGGLQGFW